MGALNAFIFYLLLIGVTLLIAKKKTWKKTLDFLGLTTKKIVVSQILLESITLVFLLFITLALEATVLGLVGANDSQKVEVVISNLSIFSILIAATIGPFAEELFFRGFLQKYAGVVLTALIFAVLHFSFFSIAEITGAFTAGIILGYWVKYKKSSLWPVILAHAVYNLISVLIVLVVK